MKIKSKLISAVALSALAPAVLASIFYVNEPYLGFEAIFTNQNYDQGYGRGVFAKDTTDYSVFGGVKFSKYFGLELGYEWQPSRDQVVTLYPGDYLPGNSPIAAGQFIVEEAYIKFRHPYLGLFGEYKTRASVGTLRFMGMIGASASHVTAHEATVADDLGPVDYDYYLASVRSYSKTKLVPMAKIGIGYDITKHFGCRATVTYRNLNGFNIRAQQGGAAEIKLKDTWGFGLGFLANF